MAFPFLANYLWGEGKNRAAIHSRTAKREHEDLSEALAVLNNLSTETVSKTADIGIERNGSNWKIKIYGPDAADEDQDIALREVDVCVDGQIKKMKIMGSLPY